ncbi:unnamed protein product [Linum grandiflorum]
MAIIKLYFLVTLLACITFTKVDAQLFDITKYGAKPDSDITQPLTKAFTEACASPTPSTVLIPAGTFKCGVIKLNGPCKAPLNIQVLGTIIAPKTIAGDTWFFFCYIDNFSITGSGTFDGQGPAIWGKQKSNTVNLRFHAINNGLVEGITSKDSKNFHVNVLGSKNFTFSKFTALAPDESPNTDGIHMGRSTDIKILDSTIATGDDCISIGDGLQQLTVERVTCGPGHGIAVGSLGRYANEGPVKGIFVRNCTLKGTTNGVRIKSWPDMEVCDVSDIHFEDIILEDVFNPIIIDQVYCPWNQCKSKAPSKVTISNVSFKNIRGTSKCVDAIKIDCSPAHPCQNVELADIDIKAIDGVAKAVCNNVKPIITGTVIPAGC